MATTNKRTTPDWTVDDAVALRNFLDSTPGLRTLAWLKFWAPTLLDGSHVNRTLVASGEVKGYTSAIEHIFSLTVENPADKPEAPEEYPSLDDDTKWDGDDTDRDNKAK